MDSLRNLLQIIDENSQFKEQMKPVEPDYEFMGNPPGDPTYKTDPKTGNLIPDIDPALRPNAPRGPIPGTKPQTGTTPPPPAGSAGKPPAPRPNAPTVPSKPKPPTTQDRMPSVPPAGQGLKKVTEKTLEETVDKIVELIQVNDRLVRENKRQGVAEGIGDELDRDPEKHQAHIEDVDKQIRAEGWKESSESELPVAYANMKLARGWYDIPEGTFVYWFKKNNPSNPKDPYALLWIPKHNILYVHSEGRTGQTRTYLPDTLKLYLNQGPKQSTADTSSSFDASAAAELVNQWIKLHPRYGGYDDNVRGEMIRIVQDDPVRRKEYQDEIKKAQQRQQGVAEGKTNKKLNEVSPEYARAAADATYTKGGDIDKRIQQYQKDSLRSLPTDLQQQFDRRANFQRYADQKRKQITPEIDVIYYGINSYGSDALMRRNLINKFPNIVNVNNANLVLDLVKQVKEKKISLEKAAYQLYISNLKAKQNNASVPAAPTTANEGIYPGKTIAGPVTGYSDLGPNAKILARRTEEAFKNPRLVAELQSIARRIEEIDPGSISLVISYYLGPKSHYEDADPNKEKLREFLKSHLRPLIATDIALESNGSRNKLPEGQGVAEGSIDDLANQINNNKQQLLIINREIMTAIAEIVQSRIELTSAQEAQLSQILDNLADIRNNLQGRDVTESSAQSPQERMGREMQAIIDGIKERMRAADRQYTIPRKPETAEDLRVRIDNIKQRIEQAKQQLDPNAQYSDDNRVYQDYYRTPMDTLRDSQAELADIQARLEKMSGSQ